MFYSYTESNDDLDVGYVHFAKKRITVASTTEILPGRIMADWCTNNTILGVEILFHSNDLTRKDRHIIINNMKDLNEESQGKIIYAIQEFYPDFTA